MEMLGTIAFTHTHTSSVHELGHTCYFREHPCLTKLICSFCKQRHPDFKFSSVQFNRNLISPEHVDINNEGPSWIIGLGVDVDDFSDDEGKWHMFWRPDEIDEEDFFRALDVLRTKMTINPMNCQN